MEVPVVHGDKKGPFFFAKSCMAYFLRDKAPLRAAPLLRTLSRGAPLINLRHKPYHVDGKAAEQTAGGREPPSNVTGGSSDAPTGPRALIGRLPDLEVAHERAAFGSPA